MRALRSQPNGLTLCSTDSCNKVVDFNSNLTQTYYNRLVTIDVSHPFDIDAVLKGLFHGEKCWRHLEALNDQLNLNQ